MRFLVKRGARLDIATSFGRARLLHGHFMAVGGHCQVASSGRVMGKTSSAGSGCRRNFGYIVPGAEGGMASRAILLGIEVMTTELEMVVGGEETRRMTR